MSLSTIVQKLEAFAEQVVSDVVAEGGAVGTKLKAIAVTAVQDGAAAVEEGFEDLVGKLGQDATTFVTNLMADDTLSGLEKANLAATQLVQSATSQGITVAEQDVTTLIKNAYLAVQAKVASL